MRRISGFRNLISHGFSKSICTPARWIILMGCASVTPAICCLIPSCRLVKFRRKQASTIRITSHECSKECKASPLPNFGNAETVLLPKKNHPSEFIRRVIFFKFYSSSACLVFLPKITVAISPRPLSAMIANQTAMLEWSPVSGISGSLGTV